MLVHGTQIAPRLAYSTIMPCVKQRCSCNYMLLENLFAAAQRKWLFLSHCAHTGSLPVQHTWPQQSSRHQQAKCFCAATPTYACAMRRTSGRGTPACCWACRTRRACWPACWALPQQVRDCYLPALFSPAETRAACVMCRRDTVGVARRTMDSLMCYVPMMVFLVVPQAHLSSAPAAG